MINIHEFDDMNAFLKYNFYNLPYLYESDITIILPRIGKYPKNLKIYIDELQELISVRPKKYMGKNGFILWIKDLIDFIRIFEGIFMELGHFVSLQYEDKELKNLAEMTGITISKILSITRNRIETIKKESKRRILPEKFIKLMAIEISDLIYHVATTIHKLCILWEFVKKGDENDRLTMFNQLSASLYEIKSKAWRFTKQKMVTG